MATQIADGLYLLSSNSLRGLSTGEMGMLRMELEKLQRETRSVVPPQDDAQAYQNRNRRISRISSALQVIVNKQSARY